MTDENKYLTPDDFTPADREALLRARSIILAKGGDTARNLLQTELEDGFFIAASGCSYSLQYDALNLKPHQAPPCDINEDEIDAIITAGPDGGSFAHRDYGGAKLAKRLLSMGLSIFEPAPLDAINAKKRK